MLFLECRVEKQRENLELSTKKKAKKEAEQQLLKGALNKFLDSNKSEESCSNVLIETANPTTLDFPIAQNEYANE